MDKSRMTHRIKGSGRPRELATAKTQRDVLKIVVTLGLLICVSVGVWWWLTDRDVRLSENGYEISKSLYAACNLADENRLAAVEGVFNTMSLTESEAGPIHQIISLARQNRWQEAAARARRLLEAQETT